MKLLSKRALIASAAYFALVILIIFFSSNDGFFNFSVLPSLPGGILLELIGLTVSDLLISYLVTGILVYVSVLSAELLLKRNSKEKFSYLLGLLFLATITALMLPLYKDQRGNEINDELAKSRDVATIEDINKLKNALEIYKNGNGNYPKELAILRQGNPYIRITNYLNQKYEYFLTDSGYSLCSMMETDGIQSYKFTDYKYCVTNNNL